MRECKTEVFLKDVANHEMVVIHDCGHYRHIRFQQPKNNHLWFELVTWPGVLTIHGDMGTWAFSRIPDMFNFFRSLEDLKINPSYWSEKLQSGPHGGHKTAKVYSDEVFERQLINRVKGMESEREEELLEAVREEILSREGEWARITAAFEFSHSFGRNDTFSFEGESIPDGREWSYHFIWCLYAIVWGIQQYDAHKATSEAA
jgi:hypothetical protein